MGRLLAGAVLALHCASRAPDPPSPTVVVEAAGGAARHAVRVEIARTEAERARGLMHRRALPEDAGMLFLFEESADHVFWMKDTLIALDIVFIGDDGRIVGIVERAQPLTLAPRSVGAPSRYVLEVNGGWTRARGVRPGDRVVFENVPRFGS